MSNIADRFDNIQIGDWPEPAPAPAPEPAAAPPVADPPASVDVPEVGVTEGNEVATQDNPPPWVLPSLPAFGDWRDPGEDEAVGQWREVKDLPSIWQPAPATLTNQLWKEYVGRVYRDLGDPLPDVGQQIAAGLPSYAPAKSSRSESLSLPSFDLFGGLFDGFSGLGLMLDGLIGLFSLTWLFGPSKPAAVPLILYAVPLELGVMVHGALVNRGVRATAVEFKAEGEDVMQEFFFNVPETQTWLAEHIMKTMKVIWRRVDDE